MAGKVWTSYNVDGSVEVVFHGHEPIADELEGRDYVPGAGDVQSQFVDVSKPMKRLWDKQPVPYASSALTLTADGIDELVLSGLPDPCSVTWPDGVVTEVSGGQLAWSVDYPGTYSFRLSSPIHLETEVSVEAVPVSQS